MGIAFQDSKLHCDSRLVGMVDMVIVEVEALRKRVFKLLFFTIPECWCDLLTSYRVIVTISYVFGGRHLIIKEDNDKKSLFLYKDGLSSKMCFKFIFPKD